MLIPIVDEFDQVIGTKDRADLDYTRDIFRTASLWITNSKGDILLAQRSFEKLVHPGKWAEAAGGVVDGNDSYEATVLREAYEELGLTGIEFQIGPKQFIDSTTKYFVQWYTVTLDKPISEFKLQVEEVAQIAWVPAAQLKRELVEMPNKFIPAMKEICSLFI